MANGSYTENFNKLDIDIPLAAPGTHKGQNISPCSVAVQGTDSVRQNDRIQLILGRQDFAETPRISARYITGKYKCTGFAQLLSVDKMECTERNAYTTISRGDFCVKLEHATLARQGTGGNSDFLHFHNISKLRLGGHIENPGTKKCRGLMRCLVKQTYFSSFSAG